MIYTMALYDIQKITSVDDAVSVSELSSRIASETYKMFSNQDILDTWLAQNAGEAAWASRIKNESSAVYCAFFEDCMIGTVWASVREGAHGTDAYIGGLYVAAPGQGIATELLNHAELRLAAWGCKSVLAEVAEHSTAKSIFNNRKYQTLGWHQGRNFKDVSWAEMRKLLMQKTQP